MTTSQSPRQTTTTRLETRTLQVDGATLTYDIRGDLGEAHPDRPVLVLAGSPMDAQGFATLATFFADRPVVTYDPRGVERSVRTDGASESTPDLHASDLHQLIEALDVGAVDLFASSGGAVNGLALVATHPDQVRTYVAHEPPLAEVLPDREHVLAACSDITQTYQRSGMGRAMAKFIALVGRKGLLTASYVDEPAPDPTAFGLPTDDDGSRDDALLGQNLRTCTGYQPDFAALAAASTRIVIAAGQESDGEIAARAAAVVAQRLGTEIAVFPSNHGGFLGGEYGMTGDPDGFAAALRQVLATH